MAVGNRQMIFDPSALLMSFIAAFAFYIYAKTPGDDRKKIEQLVQEDGTTIARINRQRGDVAAFLSSGRDKSRVYNVTPKTSGGVLVRRRIEMRSGHPPMYLP
jgi:hypothetical protein